MIMAGASLSFPASTPGYAAADGYSGLIEFRRTDAGFDLASSSSSGATHTFTANPTTTTAYVAGVYAWQLSAVKSGEKWVIESGTVEVKPNFGSASSGVDARNHVQKVLDAVEAAIERRADKTQQEVEVPGGESGVVKIKFLPITELVKVRDMYRRELRSLEAGAALAAGRGSPRTVLVRFNNR